MTRVIDGHLVRDPHDLHAQVRDQLRQATAEVKRRVGDRFDEQSVDAAVQDSYEELRGQATVESFLPILVARAAEDRLTGQR